MRTAEIQTDRAKESIGITEHQKGATGMLMVLVKLKASQQFRGVL